jgi:hypothetical protein
MRIVIGGFGVRASKVKRGVEDYRREVWLSFHALTKVALNDSVMS